MKHSSLLLVLLLFVLALLPRAWTYDTFVTVDEAYHWFERVEVFLDAVRQGEYANTNIVGHPGITTLWLGSLGRLAHQSGEALGWVASAAEDGACYRLFLRLPLALVASLCVAVAYPLLCRLTGVRVALLATLFWATEPFLIAHGQLLHLDSLLTSFVNVSLLLALVAFRYDAPQSLPSVVRWRFLVASAAVAGLAFLTKSPSIILLPLVFIVAALAAFLTRYDGGAVRAPEPRVFWLRRFLLPLVVWLAVAALVWFALWPAAWVDVSGVLHKIVSQARNDGGSPHGWGNFFLGQAVDAPGPRFYPVVLVLRLTPWTLVGLLLLPLAMRGPAASHGQRGVLAVLSLSVLLFLVMMSIPPKKFDRYLLPVFPMLTVLSAFGWVWAVDRVQRVARLAHRSEALTPNPFPSLWWLVVVAGLVLPVFWYHPYEIAWYNPLLGGGARAVEAVPVGWGEGYEQAGAFLSAQPDGCERAVAAWFIPVLRYSYDCNPWFVAMEDILEPGSAGYAVLYIDQIQRQNTPRATAWLRRTLEPVYTVRIHGIDYAEVYDLPLPNEHRLDADFGGRVRLRGYDLDSSAVRSSGVLTLTLQWEPLAPMTEDYFLFVHVLDSEGHRVGQVDVPPAGPRAPTSAWLMHSSHSWNHPVPLSPDLPTGTYWIALGVYVPDTFARLPVDRAPPLAAPDDGPDTLMLHPFTIGEG